VGRRGVPFGCGAGRSDWVFLRTSFSVGSNSPLPEPARRAHRVEQLTQALSLTSVQSQQVDAILLQRHTEVKAIHDQTDAQIDQVRQKGRHQIRAILTPEQKPKFEEFLKNLDQERKHKRLEVNGCRPIARLKLLQ